jgi:acyl-coenzyme A thioesterase PaaI-like protein
MTGDEALRAIVTSCGFGAKLGEMIAIADGGRTWTLSPSHDLIGNPLLPALHGGAVTAFIQLACGGAVARASDRPVLPRLISANVQFLAPMRLQDISTMPVIRRIGRRVAVVHAEAWQADREQPVCAAQCEFSLTD